METLENQHKQFTFYTELFIRLICLVFLFVFVDTFFQYTYLIGENGYSPVGEFLKNNYTANGISSFFKFPGLFWLSSSNTFIATLLILGTLSALLATAGIYTSLNIAFTLIIWLSFINSGSDFFIYIWDTFLFEAGLIALIVSFLNSDVTYFKFLKFLLYLLIFRLWFSMGFVTVCYNNTVPVNGLFMKYFFQNQPMPSNLSFYLYHLPDWCLKFLSGLLLFIELIVPFFIFFKKLRPMAYFLFCLFSIGIQLAGNFAWFNILTIFACLPLLIDSRFGEKIMVWLEKIPFKKIKPALLVNRKVIIGFALFQTGLQLFLLLFLFFPIGNRYLNFLNYYNYQPGFVEWKSKNIFTRLMTLPLDIGADFKLANPYGVFKGIPVKRWEVEFESYNDTTGTATNHVTYSYKPGLSRNGSYFAPHFPRLEQQLFYEAQQGGFTRNYTPYYSEEGLNCWTQRLVNNLKANAEYTITDNNPSNIKSPYLKVIVTELSFASMASKSSDGKIWQKKTVFSFFIKDSSINCPLIPDIYFSKYHKHEAPQ